MNSVIESLLQIVRTDPLPPAHTSSHWQRYGRETTVERRGDELVLRASGFEAIDPRGVRSRALHLVERLSYRSVTSRLRNYPSVWQAAKRLAFDLSGIPNFNVLKSACALAVLTDHWAAYGLSPKVFVLIGDGYGFLGALIRRHLPGTRLYCVDLPKMLVFQARIHELADDGTSMSVLSKAGGGLADIMFVLPQDVEMISEKVDCAINIASMQEMNPPNIAGYFTFLRRRSTPHSRFYCVNRRCKELPDGEIVRFYDYPWQGDDEVFIDGVCPYYTHFFAPYTLPNGPRIFGVRIPCVNYFDGVVMHRLARLAPVA